MVKSGKSRSIPRDNGAGCSAERTAKLELFGRASADLIDKLYTPIDAVNRFINLALHHIDEDSQSRQFLLESKSGVREMAMLLEELNTCSKNMKAEISGIAKSSR